MKDQLRSKIEKEFKEKLIKIINKCVDFNLFQQESELIRSKNDADYIQLIGEIISSAKLCSYDFKQKIVGFTFEGNAKKKFDEHCDKKVDKLITKFVKENI